MSQPGISGVVIETHIRGGALHVRLLIWKNGSASRPGVTRAMGRLPPTVGTATSQLRIARSFRGGTGSSCDALPWVDVPRGTFAQG